MTTQIIHCPTNAAMRKQGFYGTTWRIKQDPSSSKHVYLQYSTCSLDDQFSRKKGVAIAELQATSIVHKADLPNLGKNLSSKHIVPSIEQIYQAIIRL